MIQWMKILWSKLWSKSQQQVRPNLEKSRAFLEALVYEEEALKRLERIVKARDLLFKPIEREFKKRLQESEADAQEAEDINNQVVSGSGSTFPVPEFMKK